MLYAHVYSRYCLPKLNRLKGSRWLLWQTKLQNIVVSRDNVATEDMIFLISSTFF